MDDYGWRGMLRRLWWPSNQRSASSPARAAPSAPTYEPFAAPFFISRTRRMIWSGWIIIFMSAFFSFQALSSSRAC